MDERARLRRDVAWNLVPLALLGVVGIGLQFAIAGWWGPAALAVFDLVRIALFVCAVIGAFGLQFSVLRAVAEAPEDPARVAPIVVGALVPNLVLAAAITVVFVALHRPVGALLDSDQVSEGMLWAAPGLFCFAINKVLMCVVNGLRRMRAYAVYTSLRYLLLAVGVVIARSVDLAPAHLAGIWTFSEGTLLVVMVCEVFASVAVFRGAGWRAHAKRHLEFGARGVTATLAYEVTTKLDVWMLGAAGVAKPLVGVYSIAAALHEGAQQLAVVVATNLNPVIARELAAGRIDEVVALVRRTRRWFVPALAAACALGALAFPILIPAVLGDHEYVRGALPFAILMGGLALASPYLPFTSVLMMANRPGSHTLYVVLVCATNFVLQLILVPHFELVGAAAAIAGSIVTSALLVRTLARSRAHVAL